MLTVGVKLAVSIIILRGLRGYDMLRISIKRTKTMQKKQIKTNAKASKIVSLPIVTVASLLVVCGALTPNSKNVRADQFDDQINALRAQNSQTQSLVSGLQAQAASYQDAINRLQAQISALQTQINANLAQQQSLQAQIQANQIKLDQQRAILGDDIKSMYVDGQITTIEMLATSKNLSDFVDKQEYRTSVQNKIQDTLKTITQLQNKLNDQKAQVDQLLKDQQAQQSQLASAQAQQNSLLAYNQDQQAAYNQQINSNQSKIGDLRRQQAILNARYNIGNMKGDPNHGGYPNVWANAPQDSIIDDWGMYNRECVSWTAFKVHQDFLAGKNNHDMPYWGGSGNANQWPADARAYGIPVDNNPTPGSIAISTAGAYGHAMYVEVVGTINGQQAIYVSQYNANLDGQYSEGWRYTTGLQFLHF